MNPDYSHASKELVLLSDSFRENPLEGMQSLVYMFLPAVIEDYGGAYFKESVWAMERVTQLISCEFAIRQFFINQEEEMLKVVYDWTKHESEHVRRLASEGSRPALPWGKALNSFKKNPNPVFPILEALKDDDSLYVRKSVANNLNDISKTHPNDVIRIAKNWQSMSEKTDWIIKHGCRTLLKSGHPDVLPVFGFFPPHEIDFFDFTMNDSVKSGEELTFSFSLKNRSSESENLRIEYAVYFLRNNGEHNHKVFMISEKDVLAGEILKFEKKYSFKPISTRKYYSGKHKLSILVNGLQMGEKDFALI